jgi:diguanylate cyclase
MPGAELHNINLQNKLTLTQQVTNTARVALKNLIQKGKLPWPKYYGEEFWAVARKLGFFSVAAHAEPEPLMPKELENFLEETNNILGGVQDTLENLVSGTRNRVADMMGSIDALEDKDQENRFIEEIQELRRKNEELEKHSEDAERKIREQTKLIEQLKNQVRIDPLTGLYNRRAMEPDLKKEMVRARRYKFPLSIVMCDIDHFKKINDTYGHKIGDRVLQKLAKSLQESVRTSDNIYRYGGEEFLILLPHTDGEHAVIFAERLRETIMGMRFVSKKHGLNLGVTLSFGVTEMKPFDSISSFIARSDKALYLAKLNGRNRVELITEDV